MIELYSGTPGSGKSLHLARKVRDCLKFSCPVIGTFHINKNNLWKNTKYEYTYVNIYDLSPQFLYEYYESHKDLLKKHIEGSFLLVIDECQRIFNSREWQANKSRKEWITFFAEHRHLGFDVILISQTDIMIDRQIRALIEYNTIHRKVSSMGFAGWIMSKFIGNFVCVKTWYAIKGYNLGSEFIRGNKKLFDFYDTFEDFGLRSGEGSEAGSPARSQTEESEKESEIIA